MACNGHTLGHLGGVMQKQYTQKTASDLAYSPLDILDAILGGLQIAVFAISILALPAMAIYADKHIREAQAKQSLEALNNQ